MKSSNRNPVYGREDAKYRRVNIGVIPCVVVASLETDAFAAIVAHTDMLMVRSNPTRGREKKIPKEQWLFWGKKSPRLCMSKLRSIEFYSTESWRIGIGRCGGTHHEIQDALSAKLKFGKEKDNLEALSQKVNLMSEILALPVLRNKHLRKRDDKRIVPAQQRGTWREKCTCWETET